jgi:predicted nucleic acid-binding protein
MKVFLDTNVLVAASIRQHPHFSRANDVMGRCVDGSDEGIIHVHSLLEFHSAVTQLPGGLAVPPSAVDRLLNRGILPHLRCVRLSVNQVRAVLKRAGDLGLVGGIVYDLYHLAAGEQAGADRFYTFNTAHFRRIADQEFEGRIVAP